MKDNEKKGWGIFAIILGGAALLELWIPFLSHWTFLLAIVGLILGAIGVFVNRKNTKFFALIGMLLSLEIVIVSLYTDFVRAKTINHTQKINHTVKQSHSKSSSKKPTKANTAGTNFKWTATYFDSIVDGVTTYDEIVTNVGDPDKTSDGREYDSQSKKDVSTEYCDWYLKDSSHKASVSIQFIKKHGTYIANYKVSSGLK